MEKRFNIDEIISSLDGIQRAAPQPFLFTRIMGRMRKEDKTYDQVLYRLISRPALVLAVSCFFIGLNTYFIVDRLENNNPVIDNSQTLAAEYNPQHINPYEPNEIP
ncbi:MAG: hypothetical protein RLZZ294_228 [Bacteroidota bacterium]|jgi:hypothetical protein